MTEQYFWPTRNLTMEPGVRIPRSAQNGTGMKDEALSIQRSSDCATAVNCKCVEERLRAGVPRECMYTKWLGATLNSECPFEYQARWCDSMFCTIYFYVSYVQTPQIEFQCNHMLICEILTWPKVSQIFGGSSLARSDLHRMRVRSLLHWAIFCVICPSPPTAFIIRYFSVSVDVNCYQSNPTRTKLHREPSVIEISRNWE